MSVVELAFQRSPAPSGREAGFECDDRHGLVHRLVQAQQCYRPMVRGLHRGLVQNARRSF